jgi:copper resistance protein B
MRLRALAGIVLILMIGTLPASAQHSMGAASAAAPFGSPVADQTIWKHALLDQFEGRFGRENGFRWDGEAWMGTDTHRLWLKSEAYVEGGKVLHGQHEVLYARPISTYFDLQAGLRYDLDDRPGRGWAAFGIEGLSQYFFRVSATGYASDAGHLAGKLLGTFDLLLTQRLILQPAVELNLYSTADPSRFVGAGFSHLDAGLRLRYEIDRKFAPYIGISYDKKFGETARLLSAAGHESDALRLAFGIRAWI